MWLRAHILQESPCVSHVREVSLAGQWIMGKGLYAMYRWHCVLEDWLSKGRCLMVIMLWHIA